MKKPTNNIITIIIILTLLVLIYICSQKNKFVETFAFENYKGLKDLLVIKTGINHRRINNLKVNGNLDEGGSINIKFDILPRNMIETGEPSTNQVEQKLKKNVEEGLMNIYLDDQDVFVKDITVVNEVNDTNNTETFLDSNKNPKKTQPSEFVNSTINNHIEYLKTKKNPFIYNDRYDRYWKFNNNMDLVLPTPEPTTEEY